MNQAEHSILPPADAPVSASSSSIQDRPGILPWTGAWVGLLSVAALGNAGLIFASGGSRGYFLPVLAVLVCAMAAFFDGFTGRVPNHLTYIGVLAGLALNGLVPLLHGLHADAALVWLGAAGPRESLYAFAASAFLVGIVLLFPQGAISGIGTGDLKLLAAVSAMIGLSLTGTTALLALIVAMAYSLLNVMVMGRLNRVLQIGGQRALELLFFRRFHTPAPDEPVSGVMRFPMAIPLALGVAGTLWLLIRQGHGGFFW